ncbi:hypothetical protein E2562_005659 [Oryza meyeriana var. granulata]|uniref:Transposase Tnp1/En/Spm-like domain-containing protein n=1 Tax=Oryza meyeriana var. granulata TaxID=110450 RepID=A0A6G1BJC9_9ORYZ|nr:hypothetical protein E2562_005659 [Oryza meyeriana var. granulata]
MKALGLSCGSSRLKRSPRIEQGLEELNRGDPTDWHINNVLLDENANIIRKKVVAPRVPSRSNAATISREASSSEEQSLVGRDVFLYAILRDVPVAKATTVSTDPNVSVGGQSLGLEFYEVVVNVVLKRDALLPRPYDGIENLRNGQYMSIAWPSNRLKVSKKSTMSRSGGGLME